MSGIYKHKVHILQTKKQKLRGRALPAELHTAGEQLTWKLRAPNRCAWYQYSHFVMPRFIYKTWSGCHEPALVFLFLELKTNLHVAAFLSSSEFGGQVTTGQCFANHVTRRVTYKNGGEALPNFHSNLTLLGQPRVMSGSVSLSIAQTGSECQAYKRVLHVSSRKWIYRAALCTPSC